MNDIERRSQERAYYEPTGPRPIFEQSIYAGMNEPSRSIFGPLTPMSQRLAQDMKMQTPSSNIGDIFDLINSQQEPSSTVEESTLVASSVQSSPVRDDAPQASIAEEFNLPDDPPPEIQPPPKPPKRGKGGKASAAKKKPTPSVVNGVSVDF